jgi:hypothetical protein
MSNKHEYKNSSSVKHIDYDDANGEMEICFASGGTYRYPGVHKSMYEAMKKAESPGSYFHKQIKSRFSGNKI